MRFDDDPPATLGMAGDLLAVLDPVLQRYALELGAERPRNALRFWRAPEGVTEHPGSWLSSVGFEEMTIPMADWAGIREVAQKAVVAAYDDQDLFVFVYPSRAAAERHLDDDLADMAPDDPVQGLVEAYLAYRDGKGPAPDLDPAALSPDDRERASILIRVLEASRRSAEPLDL